MAEVQAKLSMKEEINSCSICKDSMKEPKVLPCLHIFCKSPCLDKLVVRGHKGHSLTCPTCLHLVPLQDNGIDGLLTDFHTNKIQKAQKTVEKAKATNCENCTEDRATHFCLNCKLFMCENCTDTHRKWGGFRDHEVVSVSKVEAESISVMSSCQKHTLMEANIYCNTCFNVICSDCTASLHKGHDYHLVDTIFEKHRKQLVSNLEHLKQMLSKVEEDLTNIDLKAKDIDMKKSTVETDIHREIDQLHQIIDQRGVELVKSLNLLIQNQQKVLTTQRDQVQNMYVKITRCLEYSESRLETGTKIELMQMKTSVQRRIEQISMELNCSTSATKPTVEPNIELITNPYINRACEEFGEIIGGLETEEDNTYDNIDDLVIQTADNQAYGTVDDVVFQTAGNQAYGIVDYIVQSRHFTSTRSRVPSTESLQRPLTTIRGRNGPFSVVSTRGSELIVVDSHTNVVSVLSANGEKKFSFGKPGSKKGQFKRPSGIIVDQNDSMYIVDNENHRIQKFDPKGKFKAAVGRLGNHALQFHSPIGICLNQTTRDIYVCDQKNNRIQVLTTDLKHVKCFGIQGISVGKFNYPKNAAFDSFGNLYVTDCGNNRVQVFTADGQFLRAFIAKANGEKLEKPYDIAIDSQNTVYVSEINQKDVAVFTIQGEYIKALNVREDRNHEEFRGAYGLSVDHSDCLIVAEACV